MRGKGKGYKNVLGYDPRIHSQSAKGIKQPQRISPMQDMFGSSDLSCFNKRTKKNEMMIDRFAEANHPNNKLITETVKNLDTFEKMVYIQSIKSGATPEKALEVLVNTVEGDVSQLSPALKKYAKKRICWKDMIMN